MSGVLGSQGCSLGSRERMSASPCLFPMPRRLLQQLEVVKCSKATPGKSPAKGPAPARDVVTFELYWRQEQDQFAQTAKVSMGTGRTLSLTPK